MIRRILFSLVCCLAVGAPQVGWSAGEGQSDLDGALERKIEAESLDDLTGVIEGVKSALEKGLDAENEAFAKKLLASTLVQRGLSIGEILFQQRPERPLPAPQLLRIRALALADLEQAVSLDAAHPDAHLMIARLELIPGGNRERGLKALDAALAASAGDQIQQAEIHSLRGDVHPDPKQRFDSYSQAIRLNPKATDPLLSRAQLLFEQDNLKAALADVEQAIQINAENPVAHQARGMVLIQTGKAEEAVRSLTRAIELNEDNPVSYLHRGRARLLLDQPEAAIEDLTTALTLDSQNAAALLLRADAYLQDGQSEKALSDVRRAVRIQPESLAAQRALAMVLASQKKFDEALAQLDKLCEQLPEHAGLRLQQALICRAAGRSEQALAHFAAAIEKDGESAEAYRGRGDLRVALGQYPQAIGDYQKALALDPKDSGVLNNLSWLLSTASDEKIRDGKKAIALALEACRLTDYKQAHILSTLAAGYAETGDFALARKWAGEAVRIGGEELQAQLERELESYRENRPWRETPQDAESPAARTATRPKDR